MEFRIVKYYNKFKTYYVVQEKHFGFLWLQYVNDGHSNFKTHESALDMIKAIKKNNEKFNKEIM